MPFRVGIQSMDTSCVSVRAESCGRRLSSIISLGNSAVRTSSRCAKEMATSSHCVALCASQSFANCPLSIERPPSSSMLTVHTLVDESRNAVEAGHLQ